MRDVLKRVCRGCQNPGFISKEEAYRTFKSILEGKEDPVHVSAFLTGMRMRGESEDELEGLYEAVRKKIKILEYKEKDRVDLALNYDGKVKTPHILPSALFIALSCGVKASSHGTKGVPAKFGTTFFEVLSEMLGILPKSEEVFSINNFVYADQSLFAEDLHKLLEIRKKLGFRTSINVIEKLLNPFLSECIITSVAHDPYFEKVLNLCKKAGFKRILIVKGVEGSIEPYPDRKTKIMLNGEFLEVVPDIYDMGTDLPKGNFSVKEQAEINIRILKGEEKDLSKWSVLTASLIIYTSGSVKSFEEAVQLAKDSLLSGNAFHLYQEIKDSI